MAALDDTGRVPLAVQLLAHVIVMVMLFQLQCPVTLLTDGHVIVPYLPVMALPQLPPDYPDSPATALFPCTSPAYASPQGVSVRQAFQTEVENSDR